MLGNTWPESGSSHVRNSVPRKGCLIAVGNSLQDLGSPHFRNSMARKWSPLIRKFIAKSGESTNQGSHVRKWSQLVRKFIART